MSCAQGRADGTGQEAGVRVRSMGMADAGAVARLDARAAGERVTVEGMERAIAGAPWVGLVAEREGPELVGFLLGRFVAGELEITDLFVQAACRGRGAGRALLGAALADALGRGGVRATLEVRSENVPARRLYLGAGFSAVGVRRAYYARPCDDAVVMARALAAPALEGAAPGEGERGRDAGARTSRCLDGS